MISPRELIPWTCLAFAVVVACYHAAKADKWKARSQHWFSVAMGEKPMIAQPEKLLADIFASPAPSTTHDVEAARFWRERRALLSVNHTTRHYAEGSVPSEWATEVMQLCVGPLEVEGE